MMARKQYYNANYRLKMMREQYRNANYQDSNHCYTIENHRCERRIIILRLQQILHLLTVI